MNQPSQPDQFLIVWDFDGVINTYGYDLTTILETITQHHGCNIIASNAPTQPIKHYLEQRQLASYFAKVYGLDHHHGMVERHKVVAVKEFTQAAGPFFWSMIVGDSLSDIDDGQAAGISTCLFDPHHQYDHTIHPADYTIHHLPEILDLLPLE